ncbi:hypothetical protein [Clostridium kluyveri]|uniref:DUF2062 domain-containing protein n=2 Tax=Clostridium kluyveri TaxID=1534 RepID=A0A1L5F9Z7_CLOKL|nr:hypothetical protein [Clostridium kluyveri]APM39835.1 hypothetical protein BS101_14370 [Clostridium kluyveri]UZQ50005.1 hypothetical protein OP486_18975 [Clostridium kluyveri]
MFDFYYQEITRGIITSTIMWLLVAWGVWLIPITPIVLYEAKISESVVKSIFANILVWVISVFSYYMYIPIKFVFIGQSTMSEFYISNYRNQFYWSNLKNLLWGLILEDALEWLIVAALGGLIVGFGISFLYLRLRKTSNIKIKS